MSTYLFIDVERADDVFPVGTLEPDSVFLSKSPIFLGVEWDQVHLMLTTFHQLLRPNPFSSLAVRLRSCSYNCISTRESRQAADVFACQAGS